MKDCEKPEYKQYRLESRGDLPSEIVEEIEHEVPRPTAEEELIGRQLGSTIKAYLDAVKELLDGKYSHLRELTPIHLADPGNVLIAYRDDCVVIRYERRTEERKILSAIIPGQFTDFVSLISQNVIHCYTNRNYLSEIATTGMQIKFSTQDSIGNAPQEIASLRVGFDVVIERPEKLPQPPQKPFCLLSVLNSFQIQMLGELVPTGSKLGEGQRILTHSLIRLPVGWECVEIFPYFDAEQWKPENAVLWAETDLLAAVVAKQFENQALASLDPKSEVRKQYADILQNYKDLLDSKPEREEILQEFLQNNPQLLCPTHIKFWPKLAIGARKTDFVFREGAGDYLLVEIERSTLKLFLKDGNQSRELTHAIGQTRDWKRFLEDNLSTAQREYGLDGISTNPNSLVVIGRSEFLSERDRRQLTTIHNESPKLRIMTYDDVYENAKAVVENLLGPIWNTSGNTQIYYLNGE